MNVIEVKSICKSFRIPHQRRDTAKEHFLSMFVRDSYVELHAVEDVSFDVAEGDWLGIIGRNGSGKSTLLKLISGIYPVDSGSIHKYGSLVPLLELGVGFHQELTVVQNIFFNATLLGLSQLEIKRNIDRILDFAGLRKFSDARLKNLSSGMKMRLAFSVAIQAHGEIYLFDEVFAVGDIEFADKSEKVFENMRKENKTAMIVSHDLGTIQKYCNRAIWMERGRIRVMGTPQSVCEQYRESV